jgi:catechol 2,3-dioxygenase-like lactoylglutathione lyase family enzyme
MVSGIDHVVITVRDLETAIADYSALGFTVVRGGRHSRLNTHNALIAFGDGSYFELIAFLAPPAAGAHWWYEFLQAAGGLTDFCVRSDNIEEDAAAFRRAGAAITEPFLMGRERPDGYRLSWELAVNEGDTRGLVPFFIRDITPRGERVPRHRTHRNGAASTKSLAIVVADVNSIRRIYEKALASSGERIERDDLEGGGVFFALGEHEVQFIAPNTSSGPAAERLRNCGPSLLEVKLNGAATHGVIDASRAHGARIVLA